MVDENCPDDDGLRFVRQALEREQISLGRAAEILGITREQMREKARAWARRDTESQDGSPCASDS